MKGKKRQAREEPVQDNSISKMMDAVRELFTPHPEVERS